MFCITTEHMKYYQLPILSTLDVWPLTSKMIMPTCRNFDVYLHAKILQTCYFEHFENAWSCPSIMILLLCRKRWCLKRWNQLWCLSACKKSTSSLTSCLRYCKDIAHFLFLELWECLTIPIKTAVLICRKPSCFCACKKNQLHHSLSSWDIAKK